MSTVALEIWTGAYPAITNDITIDVYEQSDPLAIVAALTHAGPSHPADTWSFPGLNRVNLLFRIFETSGGSIIRQLGADMNVVPGAFSNIATKATEQITADVTTGFSSGVNQAVFDGTGGKEDWRGWDIATLTRMGGEGVMKKGDEYSWDKNTGTLTLLKAGDVFAPGEWFNVEFEDQVSQVTSSTPSSTPVFSTPKIITANYNVSAGSDFGSLLIVRPAGNYVELTLPDIATVVPGRLLTIEGDFSATQKCGKLICAAGQVINWLAGGRGNLYFCPSETFSIYKFIDTVAAVSMWRIFAPFGNWMRVGEQIVDDNIVANVFNKILMDGGTLGGTSTNGLDVLQFARLYNDFVLNLPASQRCNYDDWATGTNIYLYSLANSANPANVGKFRIPNRLNVFERNTDGARVPGNFQAGQTPSHSHFNGVADDKPQGDPDSVFVYPTVTTDMPGLSRGQIVNGSGPVTRQGTTSTVGGADGRPANIAIRKYLYV